MSFGRSRVAIAAVCVIAAVLMLVPVAAGAAPEVKPKNLEVSAPVSSVGGCLKLTWDVDDPSGVEAFTVLRSTGPDSGYEPVFTSDVEMEDGRVMDFYDTGLDAGTTYYYRVELLLSGGGRSEPSNVASGRPEGRLSTAGGGSKQIVLSSYDQRAYFIENGVCVKSHLISTGTASHPTPHGVFQVQYHSYLVISERYGGAYCYWWMGFYPDTGMHALPYNPSTGTYTGANSLGSPASHGCVRQAVDDAKWAYHWAPDGTRIDVIGWHYEPTLPEPSEPPITGGHASQGVGQVEKEWYFAEGCTSGEFDQYILMMNPNGDTATVEATFMLPDGAVSNETYSVEGLSRGTLHVNDVAGMGDTEVSVRLVSDRPIAAERSMYFDYNGIDGGSNTVGATAPANTWYLAEGYTGGQFDEFILIQNPGIYDGGVHIQYMRPDGKNVERDYGIGAHSRLSIHVDDIPELANAEVSALVTCDQPVVVERALYFDYYGKKDGNACMGVREPSKTWYLAEGYTGGQFDTYVLIMNPNDMPAVAEVTFMRSDGKNFLHTYDLLPNSRFSIHVDDLPDLEKAEVSTFVSASREVIVERAMYFESYGRLGGADAPGVPAPLNAWSLAEGYTGGDYDTYVLVMNPNNKTVDVGVNFLLPGGGIQVGDYTVGPNSRYTIHVDSIEGLTNTEVSTTLSCEDPIICERAMYFSIPRE